MLPLWHFYGRKNTLSGQQPTAVWLTRNVTSPRACLSRAGLCSLDIIFHLSVPFSLTTNIAFVCPFEATVYEQSRQGGVIRGHLEELFYLQLTEARFYVVCYRNGASICKCSMKMQHSFKYACSIFASVSQNKAGGVLHSGFSSNHADVKRLFQIRSIWDITFENTIICFDAVLTKGLILKNWLLNLTQIRICSF